MPGGLNYIQASVSFETSIASAIAVVNLIKTTEGYKVWTMMTMIEGLLDYPELSGQRGGQTDSKSWQEKRDEELAFQDHDPDILIIGCGQWYAPLTPSVQAWLTIFLTLSGLLLAARLEALGVSYLVVEREERIGSSWRNRYAMLSLHNPSWAGTSRSAHDQPSTLSHLLLHGFRSNAISQLPIAMANLHTGSEARQLARDVRGNTRSQILDQLSGDRLQARSAHK